MQKRDQYKEVKERAAELFKEGGRTAGEIRDILKKEGFKRVPVAETIRIWANTAGLPLKARRTLDPKIQRFVKKQYNAGFTASQIASQVNQQYKLRITSRRVFGIVTGDKKPFEAASVLNSYRFGVAGDVNIIGVHDRLKQAGFPELCERITRDKGMDYWEIGLFLEAQGFKQDAIDCALCAVYSGRPFIDTFKECLKDTKIEKPEDAEAWSMAA